MGPHSTEEERVTLLADPNNRAVVSAVRDADRPLGVEELAERLVRRDAGLIETAAFEDETESVRLRLHHNRLPKLEAAGLIEYDREANAVAARTSAALPVDWEDAADLPDLVSELRSDREMDQGEIGVLEGRETIIQYGRRLADGAEEELFCMYVSPDLLEEECIRRAREAIDRGVSMYVGSGNEAVREVTRDRLPGATTWEPQLDWLNPPTYPRVGRLVLADRRKVMLAVLDEPPSEGDHPEETAVVGEGADNPLVVLVRELLGSRLDHLDYQSTDFRSELPT